MMEKTYEGQDSQESSQESCSRDSTLKMVFIFPIVFMAYFEGSMRNIQSNTWFNEKTTSMRQATAVSRHSDLLGRFLGTPIISSDFIAILEIIFLEIIFCYCYNWNCAVVIYFNNAIVQNPQVVKPWIDRSFRKFLMQFLKDLLFSFNKIFRRVSQNWSHSRGFKFNFKQHFRVVFTNSPCSFKF